MGVVCGPWAKEWSAERDREEGGEGRGKRKERRGKAKGKGRMCVSRAQNIVSER